MRYYDINQNPRTKLVYVEWISGPIVGKTDLFSTQGSRDQCLISTRIEWLPGFKFRWLGTQVNEFVTNESNQLALYFDGQFSIDTFGLKPLAKSTMDQSLFPIIDVNRMVLYTGSPAFDNDSLPYPAL